MRPCVRPAGVPESGVTLAPLTSAARGGLGERRGVVAAEGLLAGRTPAHHRDWHLHGRCVLYTVFAAAIAAVHQ